MYPPNTTLNPPPSSSDLQFQSQLTQAVALFTFLALALAKLLPKSLSTTFSLLTSTKLKQSKLLIIILNKTNDASLFTWGNAGLDS